MKLPYPSPWNFSNNDANLTSPNLQYKVEYDDLYEIAMSGPLGACCYLLFENQKVKLHDWASGPVVWEESGNKVAFPIWTQKRKQQLAVFDLTTLTLTTFQHLFSVLHLTHFKGDTIVGVHSPIYQPEILTINLNQEPVENSLRLKTSDCSN